MNHTPDRGRKFKSMQLFFFLACGLEATFGPLSRISSSHPAASIESESG
jgi:hypothetical protein